MTARYARNIFPPAHSGFAEEFESLEAEWEAMDGAEIKLGRIDQFAIDWAAQDERSAVAIWFRLRADGKNPAECVRYLEELRDCEAKVRVRTSKFQGTR